MNPQISIILPVYNGEKFVSDTINSILIQSYRNFELIIIDDGSTDNSKSLLRKIARSDKRIQYVEETNSGICQSRNNGIKAASAPYLMFCDHDDIYLPGFLQAAYKKIVKNDADFVKFGCKEIYMQNDKITKEKMICLENKVYCGEYAKDFLYEYMESNEYIWDGIYKKEAVIKAGLFDSYYKAGCEDIDLLIRLLKNAKRCESSEGIFYLHKIRNLSSTSRKYSENTYEAVIKTYEARLILLDGSGAKFERYKIAKTKQLIWAIAGMFSFQTCILERDEMLNRFRWLYHAGYFVGKMRLIDLSKHPKNIIYWLYQGKRFKALADICLLKRRISK